MSTQINVTVDSGGLLERSRQQQAANRQGYVMRNEQNKAAAQGESELQQRRTAEGRDPATGQVISSTGSRLRRVDQRPAAFRAASGYDKYVVDYRNPILSFTGSDGTRFYINTLYFKKASSSSLALIQPDYIYYNDLLRVSSTASFAAGIYGAICAQSTGTPEGAFLSQDNIITFGSYAFSPKPRATSYTTGIDFYPCYTGSSLSSSFSARIISNKQFGINSFVTAYTCELFIDFGQAGAPCTCNILYQGFSLVFDYTAPTLIPDASWCRISLTGDTSNLFIHINGTLWLAVPIASYTFDFTDQLSVQYQNALTGSGLIKIGTCAAFDKAIYSQPNYTVKSLLKT